MSEIRTRAVDSSQGVALTTAGIFAAIMLERLIGRMSELSSGQVLWDSDPGVFVQCSLLAISVAMWWVGYSTVTSVARWALSPFDLLAQVAVGAMALLLIENVATTVTGEFLALCTVVYTGGAFLNRFIVVGVREQTTGPDPLLHYPDRMIQLLFVVTALATGIAFVARVSAGPHPLLENLMILIGALSMLATTTVQLRWWTRATKDA